jgi:hypothetical protein
MARPRGLKKQITFPSARVITALSAREINIISFPKDIFESEAVQRFLSAPGNSPVVIDGDNLGYGEGQGVNLISEDGMFRAPGLPFATMVRADLPDDLVPFSLDCLPISPRSRLEARPLLQNGILFCMVSVPLTRRMS